MLALDPPTACRTTTRFEIDAISVHELPTPSGRAVTLSMVRELDAACVAGDDKLEIRWRKHA
jgi:hypothetical protein